MEGLRTDSHKHIFSVWYTYVIHFILIHIHVLLFHYYLLYILKINWTSSLEPCVKLTAEL
jgi:hypothetical protein